MLAMWEIAMAPQLLILLATLLYDNSALGEILPHSRGAPLRPL